MALLSKRMKRPRAIDTSVLAISPDTRRAMERPETEFVSEVHRKWLRSLPCCGCNCANNVMVAHVRWGTHTAKDRTPADVFTWPGCPRCHLTEQHHVGERTWWARRSVQDPAMYVVKGYALNSPCTRTREAAGRFLETGDWRPQGE